MLLGGGSICILVRFTGSRFFIFTEDFKEGFPTELADINNASWPGLVARLIQQRKVAEVIATTDKYALA